MLRDRVKINKEGYEGEVFTIAHITNQVKNYRLIYEMEECEGTFLEDELELVEPQQFNLSLTEDYLIAKSLYFRNSDLLPQGKEIFNAYELIYPEKATKILKLFLDKRARRRNDL